VLLPDDFYCRDEAERELLRTAAELAGRFAARAAAHDRDGTFPHENIADLRAAGYLGLTVPTAYGGRGGGVFAMVLGQERLARGDGSTALVVGWHLFTLGRQAQSPTWPADALERVFRDAVTRGALINAAVTEPETGSPSRGGRPTTQARRTGRGTWVLTGRKTFTTGAPALATFVVSATAPELDRTVSFLVPRDTPGLRIEETWDALGMRATGSHDLVLDGVEVPESALVEPNPRPGAPGAEPAAEVRGGPTAGWNLHIPAVYLGVARAAADFAARFAVERRPNSLQGSIAEVPHIQDKLGQMQRQLLPAYNLLFTLARRWDDDPAARPLMGHAIACCKLAVMDAALRVVDLAMRVVGGVGLSRRLPIERYYRDVRPGLHNPPMEDAALLAFARHAIQEAQAGRAAEAPA
jgi:alkylation response protein AidB-like acyl-CoA dehydrogenase